ncbi:MAG: hypothetical protein IK012_09320 [Fibrobacter sp.]|uniref:hypothetical protein n=1 Tax=Fibrobacter sp. TaxID=35828 RepID=UPI0025BB8930|nr:hypothetical protein [Fibrobacter sp.]MBR4785432.1 hypothetical protein [Fibrobacter sp.]
MNFKKIILGSVLAAASFAYIACGPDNGSGPDEPGKETPPGPQIDLPKESAYSPVVVNGLKITVMSGTEGMRGSLGGVIKLDPEFVDPETEYTANVKTTIDSVSFAVGKVIDGKPYQEKVNINLDGVVFPNEMVSFSQKYLEFKQLSSCGEFQLYISIFASSKEEGEKTTKYTTVIDTLKFVRPEAECAAAQPVESSSSVAQVCTPVTAYEDTLSNSMGTSKSAINFATGLADNPHITIKIANESATIIPGAGVSVFEESAQTTGLLPTKTPLCREDFKKSNFNFEDELTSGLWLAVVTADGTLYPMMVRKAMFESATKGTVTIVYYK